jgi:hypothetical protein
MKDRLGSGGAGRMERPRHLRPGSVAVRGDYYLYYNSAGGIGVAVADDPTGPFIDVDETTLAEGFS